MFLTLVSLFLTLISLFLASFNVSDFGQCVSVFGSDFRKYVSVTQDTDF